ncbi:hypothetical protein [Paenibacillus sp. YIM B09110]|uniref:hypothetical protein n=1 Tax=Paenibacillus sp. YIM B09110 TaxID=3126102 RepID=UPI00301B841F
MNQWLFFTILRPVLFLTIRSIVNYIMTQSLQIDLPFTNFRRVDNTNKVMGSNVVLRKWLVALPFYQETVSFCFTK